MYRNSCRFGWLLIFVIVASSLTATPNHELGASPIQIAGPNEVIVPFTLHAEGIYGLKNIAGAVQ